MGTEQQEAKLMKLQDFLQKNTRMVYVSDLMYVFRLPCLNLRVNYRYLVSHGLEFGSEVELVQLKYAEFGSDF